jgi:integrase
MGAAACLPSRTGLRALTYETLVGLLAATGLRPGEALALDEPDVDLQQGILAIRNTKFGKSRFVPIEDSVRAALARYACRRDVLLPLRETCAFLVSARGRRVTGSTARHTFAKLSQTIGNRAPKEGGRMGCGPRMQDLRHTFATGRMLAWYRAGLDVERLIPALATYLGHGRVQDTYWYIEAIPELLQFATEHQATRAAGGGR